jgi:hypothetical protein
VTTQTPASDDTTPLAQRSPEQLASFLAEQRTCRVATVSKDGRPHVGALWFVWDGESLWLYSIVRSQRWTDLLRDPRVSVVIDDGVEYGELRGVELSGTVEFIGEAPRTGEPVPALETPERGRTPPGHTRVPCEELADGVDPHWKSWPKARTGPRKTSRWSAGKRPHSPVGVRQD